MRRMAWILVAAAGVALTAGTVLAEHPGDRSGDRAAVQLVSHGHRGHHGYHGHHGYRGHHGHHGHHRHPGYHHRNYHGYSLYRYAPPPVIVAPRPVYVYPHSIPPYAYPGSLHLHGRNFGFSIGF